jgi:hypothetical protein
VTSARGHWKRKCRPRQREIQPTAQLSQNFLTIKNMKFPDIVTKTVFGVEILKQEAVIKIQRHPVIAITSL